MKKQIKSNVFWVGKNDWELRQFHGYEYSTHKGSTYNSYLIREEKTVLIDTVFQPFSSEFIKNLTEEIELSDHKSWFLCCKATKIVHCLCVSCTIILQIIVPLPLETL